MGQGGYVEPLLNVLMFVPLGLALAVQLAQHLRSIYVFLIVFVLCAAFSLTIETLQLLVPSRHSTLMDLLTNTLGGGIGYGIHTRVRRWAKPISLSLAPSVWMFGFVGYAALTFGLSAYSGHADSLWRLGNWDRSFPLLVGNEGSGSRPWFGEASELFIADRAWTAQEAEAYLSTGIDPRAQHLALITYYPLDELSGFQDQTGTLPDLVDQPFTGSGAGGTQTERYWLKLERPAERVADRIMDAAQFSVGAQIIPSYGNQAGPARIISYSKNFSLRNFTIGQQGNGLVLRVRTPFNGENGANVEFEVPNVLSTGQRFRFVLTFDETYCKLYTNHREAPYLFALSPENRASWFFSYLITGEVKVGANKAIYKILFYGIIFVPLGALWACLCFSTIRRLPLGQVLSYAGLLNIPFILIAILSVGADPSITYVSPLLGTLFMGIGYTAVFFSMKKEWDRPTSATYR